MGADRSAIGVSMGWLVSLLLTGVIVYMLYHLSSQPRTESVTIAPKPVERRHAALELAQVPWAAGRVSGKSPLTISTATIPWKAARPGLDAPYAPATIATAAVPKLKARHDVKRPTPVSINLAKVPNLKAREKPAPPPATLPATRPMTQPATTPAQQARQQ